MMPPVLLQMAKSLAVTEKLHNTPYNLETILQRKTHKVGKYHMTSVSFVFIHFLFVLYTDINDLEQTLKVTKTLDELLLLLILLFILLMSYMLQFLL